MTAGDAQIGPQGAIILPVDPYASGPGIGPQAAILTGEVESQVEREARAYREGVRRLRLLHTTLAGRRQDWANSSAACSAARAVAYQSAMSSVHSIIDEVEAIAGGQR